ncbi:MAG: hypothetical protein K1X53_02355 [Candidatus Sumerlaeaceae bacterium]|nr:hypothetical protein [Candidatus Sumerlaeaceae bacterium]
MSLVEKHFAQFGPEVIRMVEDHVRLNGNALQLLKQFHLPATPTPEGQLVALKNFIYQFGITFFVSAIRSNLSPDEIERMKARKLLEGAAQRKRPEMNVRTANLTPPGGALQSHATPHSGVPVVQPPLESSPAVSAVKMIDTPGYKGPDRRVGAVDRRVGPADRRLELDLILKNKRFGGRDRRKVVRREADRLRLAEKQKTSGN